MSSQSIVHVVATTIEGTRAALAAAVPLAAGSGARLLVLVPQVVPYPLPVDGPVDATVFTERRYRSLVLEANGVADVRVCLCRAPYDVIRLLPEGSTVVVGGRSGGVLPSREERLSRALVRRGHHSVFVACSRPFGLACAAALVAALVLSGLPSPVSAQTTEVPQRSQDAPASQAAVSESSPLDGVVFGIGLDGYAMWNANGPVGRVNLLRAYDVTSNSFSLNQANVIVERAPDVSKGRRMGLRLDVMFGQATETLQGSAANEPRPQVYRNLFQAYGTYIFPVGKGLQADFGKFASALGFENNYTKDQINYSRSYFFNFLPFYHFGFRTTYPVGDRLSLTYWLVNGAQQSEDFNGFKSQAAIATIKPVPSVSWNVNYYSGREYRDLNPLLNPVLPTLPAQPGLSTDPIVRPDRSRLNILDTYVAWTKGPMLLGTEGDYVAVVPDDLASPSSTVKGGAAYAQYRLSPQIQLATRYEYFSDGAGLFSGRAQNLQDVTVTATWQPADGTMLRVEWRNDHSDHPFFLGPTPGDTRANQQTITLGLVFWFGSKQGAW